LTHNGVYGQLRALFHENQTDHNERDALAAWDKQGAESVQGDC